MVYVNFTLNYQSPFSECKVSSPLWKEIEEEFYPYLVLPDLDIKLILFGVLYDQDQQKIKNHIILIFKKFLYQNRDCIAQIKLMCIHSRIF